MSSWSWGSVTVSGKNLESKKSPQVTAACRTQGWPTVASRVPWRAHRDAPVGQSLLQTPRSWRLSPALLPGTGQGGCPRPSTYRWPWKSLAWIPHPGPLPILLCEPRYPSLVCVKGGLCPRRASPVPVSHTGRHFAAWDHPTWLPAAEPPRKDP